MSPTTGCNGPTCHCEGLRDSQGRTSLPSRRLHHARAGARARGAQRPRAAGRPVRRRRPLHLARLPRASSTPTTGSAACCERRATSATSSIPTSSARQPRARSMSRCSARPSGPRGWAFPMPPGSGRWSMRSTGRAATSASRPASSASASAISGPTGRWRWRSRWWPSRIPMSWRSAWAATRPSSRRPISRRPIGWRTRTAWAAPCMPARWWGRRASGPPSATCR